MAAQIGPDWVQGIAGLGSTVADALRYLAHSFDQYRYELRGNSVGIDAAGEFIEVTASPGQSPADVLFDAGEGDRVSTGTRVGFSRT